MTAPKTPFVYTPDMLDSDAANARSAGYRVIRDAAGLPVDAEGSLTDTAKALHNAAGTGARNAANVVFKAMTGKKPRKDWTPEQSEKVHTLMAVEGIKAYRLGMTSAGYKTPDSIEADALNAFKKRLVERRAMAEVTHATASASGVDEAAKSIFG